MWYNTLYGKSSPITVIQYHGWSFRCFQELLLSFARRPVSESFAFLLPPPFCFMVKNQFDHQLLLLYFMMLVMKVCLKMVINTGDHIGAYTTDADAATVLVLVLVLVLVVQQF